LSDPFRPSSHYSEKRWSTVPAQMDRCDSPNNAYSQQRPKPVSRLTEPVPYTPTKSLTYGNVHAHGAPRYPYTPDSSRMIRRSTDIPSSPPSWDNCSEDSASPVQNALSSCLAHFENLIHSHQPDEYQMEFIVQQFEAMTTFLSAPDSQTKKIDEHLFTDLEQSAGAGLGISESDETRAAKMDQISREAHDAYVTEVGTYIASVKAYIADLKTRLDEVKTLNSIQLDVITDLRRQMKTVRSDMRSTLDMREDVKMVEEELERLAVAEGQRESAEFGLDSWATLVEEDNSPAQVAVYEKEPVPEPEQETEKGHAEDKQPLPSPRTRRTLITIVRKPERRSFWNSIGEALDLFGKDFLAEE
jgi:hypothetical protein